MKEWKNKKSQIKIGENVAIMFIFFIIIIFVIIYFYNISQRSAKIEKLEKSFEQAIKISEHAMYMTELQCSYKNVIKSNCIDKYKIEPFYALLEQSTRAKEYYYSILGFSTIEVEQIFPTYDHYLVYNNTPPNAEEEMSKFVTQVPILIMDDVRGPEYYNFGIMTTTFYS